MIADERLYVSPRVSILMSGKRLLNWAITSGPSSYQSQTTSLPPSAVLACWYSSSRWALMVGQ